MDSPYYPPHREWPLQCLEDGIHTAHKVCDWLCLFSRGRFFGLVERQAKRKTAISGVPILTRTKKNCIIHNLRGTQKIGAEGKTTDVVALHFSVVSVQWAM